LLRGGCSQKREKWAPDFLRHLFAALLCDLCGQRLCAEVQKPTAESAEKRRKGREEKQNQSAIPGVGRKLMAESAISHPDQSLKIVYAGKKDF
jgi:hypothetical protein